MTNDFTIRQLAKELQSAYSAMNVEKHSPGLRREARTQRPAPGPQSPGNFLWINRSVMMEQRLREVAFNAFSDIQVKLKDEDGRVHNLLERIHGNSFAISELPWASDFIQELDDQVKKINRWLTPAQDSPRAKEIARQAGRRFTAAEAAALASTATGLKIDRKQVTYWGRAESKNVDAEIGSDGVATYSLEQVIAAAEEYKDQRKKSA